jgi:hypothetical protein
MGWRCTVTTPTGGGPEGSGCAVADVANVKMAKKTAPASNAIASAISTGLASPTMDVSFPNWEDTQH